MLDSSMNTIKTVIAGDATVTAEQRKQIESVLNPKAKLKQKFDSITTKEAIRILGCSKPTLRKYQISGYLNPKYYSQRRKRWDRHEVEWFRDNGISTD